MPAADHPSPRPASPAPRRPQSAADARAEVEARKGERDAARRTELAAAFPDGTPGRWAGVLSWVATGALTVVTALAAADPDRWVAPFFAVALVLFFAGSALFVVDILLAAARSRTHAMGIGGLFFLAGCAPRRLAVSLNLSLAVAVVVAVAGAAARPYTPLAFGTLAPLFPLAVNGLWGVLHGHFPPRPELAAGSRS